MWVILVRKRMETGRPIWHRKDAIQFFCFDDLSVGPVSQWGDPAAFLQERNEFWRDGWLSGGWPAEKKIPI